MEIFGIEIETGVQIWFYILIAFSVIRMAIRYHHRQSVKEMVEKVHGKLISCKRQYSVFGVGPYSSTGRYSSIYYYVYELDGKNKNGWVKFSIFSKPDWRV